MRKVPASNSRLDAGTLRCVTISKMQGAEDETDRFREEPGEVKMKVYEVLFLLSRTFYFPHKQDCSRLVLYDLE